MAGFDSHGVQQPHTKLYADAMSAGLRTGKYLNWDKNGGWPGILQQGTQVTPVTVPTLPTAVQDNVNIFNLPGAFGNGYVEMYQTTAQAIMPAPHASKGLEIGLDQVNNEAVEYVFGGNRASNPMSYLAGTDPGVFLRATFEIEDASGLDQFGIIWRKQEDFIVPTSFLSGGDGIYTDFVMLGFCATAANPNPVGWAYDLANSGSTTVFAPGFTVADSSIITFEIQIKARVARGFINGVPLGGRVAKNGIGTAITAQNTKTPPKLTMTNALRYIPGIFLRQDADISLVYLRNVTCGQLLEDGLQPEGR
jgi:hypothetical protein